MANYFLSLPILSLSIAIFFHLGGILKLANGLVPEGAWCVAKPSTSEESLMNNINYACGIVDCGVVQKDGPCFTPNTDLLNHASVVMNIYYQKYGRNYWNCYFTNSAIISITDPSYGDCKYTFPTVYLSYLERIWHEDYCGERLV